MVLFLGVVVFLLVWFALRFRNAVSKGPPGPTPLPILGNMWMLGFKVEFEKLIELSKTYGSVYRLWMGHTPMLVVNGFHAVKEALVHHADVFSDRPAVPFFQDLCHSEGIILSSGQPWKHQRRFALKALRNLGLGKKSLEWRIQKEACKLVKFFAATKGNPVDPQPPISACVSNVISWVVFGHGFSFEDIRFQQLLKASETIAYFQGTVWGRLYDSLPWLMRHLPGPHKNVFKEYRQVAEFVREEIAIHRKNWTPDEPQDLIDYYLAELLEGENSAFSEENMIQVVFDFFMAGSETTTATLAWALLYMLENPDVQDQVKDELDAVLGLNQPVNYEDRTRLPYTNAVVHEIQRFANLVPGAVMHVCNRDTTFMGLPVSKGTVIYPNLGSVLYDPEQWETPQQFNPGHFLDKDGKFVCRESFLVFSTGPRVCLGERLARVELFIFFTSLIQNFKFQLPEGQTHINMDSIIGSMRQPHPFKICAVAH
ncbi:cytochrome P450 2J2-like [Lissotriton helveticus]